MCASGKRLEKIRKNELPHLVIMWASFKTFCCNFFSINGNYKNLRNIYINSQVRKKIQGTSCYHLCPQEQRKVGSADTASETLVFLLLGPRHCDRRGWEHCFLVAYVWPVWQWEIGTEPRRQVRGRDWPEEASATQPPDPHCLIVSGSFPCTRSQASAPSGKPSLLSCREEALAHGVFFLHDRDFRCLHLLLF